jgi:hypothetical protein
MENLIVFNIKIKRGKKWVTDPSLALIKRDRGNDDITYFMYEVIGNKITALELPFVQCLFGIGQGKAMWGRDIIRAAGHRNRYISFPKLP